MPLMSSTCAHEACHGLSCRVSELNIFSTRISLLSCAGPMATCCVPRCGKGYDVVRYCPRCEASFAVCSAHHYAHLSCPWPIFAGIPCFAQVPLSMDQHWRAPLAYGPMYICPPAHTGEPPGLHRATDTEHISTARMSQEPPVNTDARGSGGGNRTGATKKKKQFAAV